MPVPNQGLDFKRHNYVVIFFSFSDLRWQIVACSFCWYWWNSWPSLFKHFLWLHLYIHVHIFLFLTEYSVIKVSNKVFQYISVESVYFLFVQHVHFHNFFPYIGTISFRYMYLANVMFCQPVSCYYFVLFVQYLI